MTEYISHSPAETAALGEAIGKRLPPGSVLALEGGLGMGKTCLVGGIARGLGYTGEVSSPTFALVNEYVGGRFPLYHFDMYRVSGWDDLYSTGFFEYLESGGALAVEWSENIAAALPEHAAVISIAPLADGGRKITITGGITPDAVGS